MNFWDQQYALPDYKYGAEANAFLQAQTYHMPSVVEVLLPGDGEGATVFGWQVWGTK